MRRGAGDQRNSARAGTGNFTCGGAGSNPLVGPVRQAQRVVMLIRIVEVYLVGGPLAVAAAVPLLALGYLLLTASRTRRLG